MDIQRLAYIALKDVLKNDRQQGEILMLLKSKGIDLSDTQIREVADYIVNNNFGKQTPISKGRIIICATSNATDFVNRQQHIPFEQRLRLIYSELLSLPERKGDLETILKSVGLDYNVYDISNYAKHCNNTGQARCFDTKTGCEITLTQIGIDFLYHEGNPVQESVSIQNIAIGNSIIQSSNSRVEGNTILATNIPSINETPQPTKNKFRVWLYKNAFNIIFVIIGILTLVYTILGVINH